MLGIFDSGLGGLRTMEYIHQVLPDLSILYLGDTKYLPYGEKDPEFLRDRTCACLDRLFVQGCSLVILACNTASAYAIRHWQSIHPEQKVLSVTIPGIEAIVAGEYHRVAILATAATVRQGLYPEMMSRHYPLYKCDFLHYSGSGLVELLESDASENEIITKLEEIFADGQLLRCDALLLGSTHYPLLLPVLKKLFPDIPTIDPGREAAQKLPAYLARHPEIVLDRTGKIYKYVTGNIIPAYGEVMPVEIN